MKRKAQAGQQSTRIAYMFICSWRLAASADLACSYRFRVVCRFSIQVVRMAISFDSARLLIKEYEIEDAGDLFACISPSVTTFMPWEPPQSVDDLKARRQEMASSSSDGKFRFVIRSKTTTECLGATSIDDAESPTPEIGIWLRETAHGFRYGSEVIKRLCEWAAERFNPQGFVYPVAVGNWPSRRIAERLGGIVTEHRTNPKYASVVYQIPRQP